MIQRIDLEGILWTWIKALLNTVRLKDLKVNKPLLFKMLDIQQGIELYNLRLMKNIVLDVLYVLAQ